MAVQVHNRNDQQPILANLKNDAIRKSVRQTAPCAWRKTLPRNRILGGSSDRSHHFIGELKTKARTLFIVVPDRILQLNAGNIKEADVHFLLIRSITSANGSE